MTTKRAKKVNCIKTPAADRDLAAVEALDATLALYVAVLRQRLAELADALGTLDNIQSHPDRAREAALLRPLIDPSRVARLVNLIDEAAEEAAALLESNAVANFPDLTAPLAAVGALQRCGFGGRVVNLDFSHWPNFAPVRQFAAEPPPPRVRDYVGRTRRTFGQTCRDGTDRFEFLADPRQRHPLDVLIEREETE